ncbi:hypothetical protein [Neptuniibacter sp.]|uniref:hypothetical protein n=1 Tax=Neptuniibacter sp. TaxID=1962643 RepID=UPI003B5BF604
MSKRALLRFPSDATFKDLEDLAKAILSEEDSELWIPNSLKYNGGFGVEGAALQVIGTWLRSSKTHVLRTYAKKIDDPVEFSKLCSRLFGLCSLRLADEIHNQSKKPVELKVALNSAVPSFKSLRQEDYKLAFKGLYVTIPSIKAHAVEKSKDREFDNPLYNLKNEVVDAEKFLEVTESVLGSILTAKVLSSMSEKGMVPHIAEILRELFTNTHRHARSDGVRKPYIKNFRSIVFNTMVLTEARAKELSSSGASSLFFGEWMPKGKAQLQALDITIVDSGPGFARKWFKTNSTDFSIEDEKQAIVDCFTKHNSSDPEDSSGSGLSNVLKDLKQLRGWMRLRTGRTLLEKSFFTSLGDDSVTTKDINGKEVFMEGVVFNVVIPIEALKSN